MSDALLVLKKYFGHNDFRAGQKDVVDAILQGKDVLAVMPTGAGKSVCFQVPALMLEGVTIVVSPLISLMKDQVTALGQAGVPAAYINSSLTQTQIETVLNRAAQGKYKLIYVAPERLLTTDFLALSANLNISLLAIDEAHCVSQWGQDFRPNYLMIPQYIQNLSRRPVVAAFTATATPMVKMDIWKLLKLKEPFCITTGFDRPNLFFRVETPSKKTPRLIEFLYEHRDECGIVYCSTRRKVEEITLKLQEAGFSAARYHAGLDDAERKQNQEDFSNDNIQIIVATNAFGMGIDKSNVSFVVHYNMPKNIESYYQEAGRAGRDGSPAHCLLLFCKGDITTAKRFIYYGAQNEMLTEEQRAQIQKQDLKRLDQMVEYCTTDSCLRAYLLRYFGDKAEDTCNMCGNCKTAEEREEEFNEAEFFSIKSPNLYHVVGDYIKQEYGETFDITVQAQKILSAVARAQKIHPNGIGRTALVRMLNGSKEKRQAELGLDKLSTYGILSDVPRKTLTQYVDYLHELGYLAYTDSYYPTVTLTSAAGRVLFENEKVKCPMSYLPTLLQPEKKKKAKKSKKKKTTVIWQQEDTLYNTLKALRFELAKKANIPAYMIFSNATLLDMAKRMPETKKQMLQVNGVGEMKLEKYGNVFLRAIQTWLKNEEAEG